MHILSLKGDVLTYISLLFAVQIPVFILLLEKMADAGYVRRKILPGVIRFRELLISYVLLSLLLLISVRTAYYYLPVFILTVLSIITIVEAVHVLFEQRKLRERESAFVSKIVSNVMGDSLAHRAKSNAFIETLKVANEPKKRSRVTHIFLEFGRDYKGTQSSEVRAKNGGHITNINVTQLQDLMAQRFSTVGQTIPEVESDPKRDDLPKVVLSVRPGSSVKAQESLMKLVILEGMEPPDNKFLNKLRKAIDIEPDGADSEFTQLEDLVTDFKQQLRDAVDKDNVVLVEQALDFYKELLNGFTSLSKSVSGSEYSFINARQEFQQFMPDSVSKQIGSISDIINDELQRAIRGQKLETTKTITSFLYSELLRSMREDDILRAAFSDYALIFTIGRLVYDENYGDESSGFQRDIFQYISLRLREHTDLLLYNYRNEDHDSPLSKTQLEEWIKSRINDVRGFLLTTYKKSNHIYFNEVLKIINELEKNYRFHEDEIREFVDISRCTLLLVAAYMNSYSSESEEQIESHKEVDDIMLSMSTLELTQLLVNCVDNDYADQWRVDTVDMSMDGGFRTVPDYNIKVKTAWVDYMLKKGVVSTDTSLYSSIPLGTTRTFSDGLPDQKDAFLIRHLDELIDDGAQDAKELKQLVINFISERKDWEENTLAAAPLDETKVNEFTQDIIKGYNERALAMRIFDKAEKIKKVSSPGRGYLTFGWNEIREKAPFVTIPDWPISYGLEGESRGSEIANKENELVTTSLLGKPTTSSNIEEWLKNMQGNDTEEWIIFNIDVSPVYIRRKLSRYIELDPPFNDIYFKGVKQPSKSKHLYHDKLPNGLYAIAASELGTLSIKSFGEELIDISVVAYSDDKKLREALLKELPGWLEAKGTRQKQEEFLRTMVRMRVHHTFKYEPMKAAKVYYLAIDEQY